MIDDVTGLLVLVGCVMVLLMVLIITMSDGKREPDDLSEYDDLMKEEDHDQ